MNGALKYKTSPLTKEKVYFKDSMVMSIILLKEDKNFMKEYKAFSVNISTLCSTKCLKVLLFRQCVASRIVSIF